MTGASEPSPDSASAVDDASGGRCDYCNCCTAISAKCRRRARELSDFSTEVKGLCSQLDVKQKARRLFTVEQLKNRLPVLKWIPKYRLRHLQGDVVAGLTVALTLVPQSIAYAQIANLDSKYGLYSSFMACFAYAVLGTSKDIAIGPVAIVSLLVSSFALSPIPGDATYAIMVSLIGGAIQVAIGLLHIGFVIEYISHPVINSFTTASAITIAEAQFKKWLGLKNIPRGFLADLTAVLSRLDQAKLWDFLLGLVCMILLRMLKRVKEVRLRGRYTSVVKRILQYPFWLLGTARNAVAVFLAGIAYYIFLLHDISPFTASNQIPAGLPPFTLPRFSLYSPTDNRTITTGEIFNTVASGFILIPVIGLLESIAVGKAFANMNRYRLDANQELIALGISNILGSFVSAYPVTGSFSRTAVNSQSGVQTPMSGILTGVLVILSLLFLTPLFNYIPDASLAAVIISAVYDLIDFSLLPKLWRVNKIELIPWMFTFLLCLLIGVEYGIIVGIGISLLMLLGPWSKPGIKVVDSVNVDINSNQLSETDRRIIVLTVEEGLQFPGMEYFKDKMTEEAADFRYVIVDFSSVSRVDYTTVHSIHCLITEAVHAGSKIVFCNPRADILQQFVNAKLEHFLHANCIDDALQLLRDMEKRSDDCDGNVQQLDGVVVQTQDDPSQTSGGRLRDDEQNGGCEFSDNSERFRRISL